MKLASLLLLLGVLSCLLVAQCSRTILFHRDSAPPSWVNHGLADPTTKINFYIALRQVNVEILEDIIYDIAHPRSPNYGNWLTQKQILDIIAPPKADHDKVVSWLLSHDVLPSEITSLGDSLHIQTQVYKIENLFQTTMHLFQHEKTSRKRIAHLGPISVPDSINDLIDMVSALSLFPPTRKPAPGVHEPSNTNPWAIPPHLRSVYSIPASTRATNPKNWQAAVEFEWPGYFAYSDMKLFSQLIGMPYNNISRVIPENEWINEGYDGESALDLQLISNVGSGVNTAYFTNEHWIYEFTQTILTMQNPPLVYSLSWGWMEFDQCNGITHSECQNLGVNAQQYVQRTNTELLKLGNMGFTVLVCTQDEGAPSDENSECQLDSTNTPVWPIYPASSPWVTAVGATTLVMSTQDKSVDSNVGVEPVCLQYTCNNGTEEVVAMSSNLDTLFTSGGGFSNYTVRPSYQDAAIKTYLSSKSFMPPTSMFGYLNRGYPDISAAGSRMLNVLGGDISWNGGTSASTPVTSGVISLLNDYVLNSGKKGLGFLNIMLYDMGATWPQAFNDITVGNNSCTGWADPNGGGVYCCEYGFGASTGWDAATGWGTPNYAQMLKYIQKVILKED